MSNDLKWTPEAWESYLYWQGQDKKTLKRINQWIAELLAWELSDTSEEETRFLLSNEANRKHLEKSIRQYRNR